MNKKVLKKFGFIFGENFESSSGRKNLPTSTDLEKAITWEKKTRYTDEKKAKTSISAWRMLPIYLFFAAVVAVLFTRAFELQAIKGSAFLGEAAGNHVRVEVDHAPRGVIYDRNGSILAQNKPGFRLFLEPEAIPDEKKTLVYSKLIDIFDITEKDINSALGDAKEAKVTLTNQVSSSQAINFEANKREMPGVGLEVSPVRIYPHKEITSHILGYTGEVNEDELRGDLEVPYQVGDKVGRAGVESSFEEVLRGTNGYRLINVSADGDVLGEIYHNTPLTGQSVTLGIDIELQKFVYEELKKYLDGTRAKAASVVVLDPKTGEVLALVSLPSYDNNIFAKDLAQKDYEDLVNNPQKLLLNRSIGASYPPGSTFKMVTAVAGLETGTIKPNTKIEDKGFVALGEQVFNNWLWTDHRKTEGSIDVVRALARSTDTFFYELGRKMGEEKIQRYARVFDLGEKTGLQLPEETSGLVPDNEWKLATKGEPWYPGETLNISIGQGDLLVTPLQISRAIAVFANGGKLITPTIVKSDRAKVEKEDFIDQETLKTVQKGLYQNTVGDGNVGWLFRNFKVKTAGKTGTAEAGEKGPHAWYTGYMPYDSSAVGAKIVATAMIEHAGHGSEEAAPIVKRIFEWWFDNR